jgi:hypothetical protein
MNQAGICYINKYNNKNIEKKDDDELRTKLSVV